MDKTQDWRYSFEYGWTVYDKSVLLHPVITDMIELVRCSDWSHYYESVCNYNDKSRYLESSEYIKSHETVFFDIKNTKTIYQKLYRDFFNIKLSKISKIFSSNNMQSLWHITHVDNIGGVDQFGLLNRYSAELNTINIDISDSKVQDRRMYKEECYHRSVKEYVPLYVNQKNSMMSVLKHRYSLENLCLIEIDLSVMLLNRFVFTDGNAASRDTKVYCRIQNLTNLPWNVINANMWSEFKDGKRKRSSEVLIYEKIDKKYIKSICFPFESSLNLIPKPDIKTRINLELF